VPLLVKELASGAEGGCSDQAVATVYQKHRVNGGRNYNGPKVAKFLVG